METFLRVADVRNFNKAAVEGFITPTAVIKQINLLEESLGVSLFERTYRGLILTEAGKSMYQDAKYIIQYCKDSVDRAKNAREILGNLGQNIDVVAGIFDDTMLDLRLCAGVQLPMEPLCG